MNPSDDTQQPTNDPQPATPKEKRAWETPMIYSTEVFETFTLQSCNQTPGDACQGALE